MTARAMSMAIQPFVLTQEEMRTHPKYDVERGGYMCCGRFIPAERYREYAEARWMKSIAKLAEALVPLVNLKG